MKAQLTRARGGLYYTLTHKRRADAGEESGNRGGWIDQEIIVQSDWSYPALASLFGFVPCECGMTDGTVDCEHKTATEMISAAVDFLDAHDGATVRGESVADYFGE